MDNYSYLSNAHPDAIEEMYSRYLSNPDSLEHGWKKFFEGFEFARTNFEDSGVLPENVTAEIKVMNLIHAYRQRGHLFTKTNPVRDRRKYTPTLDIENFGLAQSDLEKVFQAGAQIGIGAAKLKDIVAHLDQTYCQSIGVEYLYMRQPEVIDWLREKMEGSKNTPSFSVDEKKTILNKLNQAVVFENFLATKFVGQKRFSLEGGESLIPAMDMLMETGADLGIKDYVVGMAHRGRLNVLANILNKTYRDIFTEFEGRLSEDSLFDGDVKYHLGYSSDQTSNNGKKVHISLTPNPSHLETVDAIVEGITRAKMDNLHNGDENSVCPVLIHGDAAVAGQGIVYEVIQMSQLDGYRVGGTVHLVVNNQVGFTTNYLDARSSTYCTDVAKVTLSPVFHVNGDDVEAVVFVAKLAMEFRQKFHRDVFIDILCYRKYGHNEGDEPRFTQPVLYKAIQRHPNPREIYVKKLVEQGSIEAGMAKDMERSFKDLLEGMLNEAKQTEKAKITSFLEGQWAGVKMAAPDAFDKSPDTAIDKKVFLDIAGKIVSLPDGMNFFNKIQKLFEDRKTMIANDQYDWAMGELMAYATLMHEGHHVRFSGQDVERGTFSHRHAVVKVEDSEEEYTPLNNFGAKGQLRIFNSHLSEYGVLGFEYGYAMAAPNALTIWEAQFGDFFNGAQIIIDQYISSAEYKWRRMNGLVVLLPHGYEGQGPEHSSARMERFLQMCAENNMQIVNATTPANQFHVLRRQIKREFRKPLICFTPKKLLRFPACVSSVKDFTSGGFQEVIDDVSVKAADVKKLVLCSGKIYYEMMERKAQLGSKDVAFVRIEQLYPWPAKQIAAILSKYSNAKEICWLQEEAENMGAYTFVMKKMKDVDLTYIGRKESASPATGYAKLHNAQSEEIFAKVFGAVNPVVESKSKKKESVK
ncbi:MAG TPA: 2-oxoglutarate dehydrogenase E1 component [Flavobacteriales bacterium]|nr:2-oxoglutarate dehydrogenase E1 component [Flavobacteriales bacterium]HRE95605.1 2-oxoglutarate dehydrogenase E1 component [Flavobacteriales bacterium]HRJ38546.1 2-oxoglutarate dehydrogenase E1 component [Flavobacteriales bacterium]